MRNHPLKTAILALMLSCLTLTGYCKGCNIFSVDNLTEFQSAATCDVTFSAIPYFPPLCVLHSESGIYTITNNTPVTIQITSIQIAIHDALPPTTTTITAAPINNCGSSLAAGASCNIMVNIVPTVAGTLNRNLVIGGINTRQKQLVGPAIAFTVCPIPPPMPPALFCYAPLQCGTLNCSIYGGSAITNSGLSNVNGNLCLQPGTSITGFPPGIITNGNEQMNNGTTIGGADTITNIQVFIASQPCTSDLSGQNLGGLTLTPGTYCISMDAPLTGALTLSGGPSDYFYFRIAGTLSTANNASVVLIGGAVPEHVFWYVNGAVTIGAYTFFQGNIVSNTSITLGLGASALGKLLTPASATNSVVTTNTNAVIP